MLKAIGFIVIWVVVFATMESCGVNNHVAYASVGATFGIIGCFATW